MDKVQMYTLGYIAAELVIASFFTGVTASDSHSPGFEIFKGFVVTTAVMSIELPFLGRVLGWF